MRRTALRDFAQVLDRNIWLRLDINVDRESIKYDTDAGSLYFDDVIETDEETIDIDDIYVKKAYINKISTEFDMYIDCEYNW